LQSTSILIQGKESKKFEYFHKLIKELVQPDKQEGAMYIDRQAAVIYYSFSLRTLRGLKKQVKEK